MWKWSPTASQKGIMINTHIITHILYIHKTLILIIKDEEFFFSDCRILRWSVYKHREKAITLCPGKCLLQAYGRTICSRLTALCNGEYSRVVRLPDIWIPKRKKRRKRRRSDFCFCSLLAYFDFAWITCFVCGETFLLVRWFSVVVFPLIIWTLRGP